MNLCPCGARGDPALTCACTAERVHRYREKLSRALLDRFDLTLIVPRARAAELAGAPGEPSEPVRARVVAARERLRAAPPALGGPAQRVADPSGRAAPAFRSWPRPSRTGRGDDRGARRRQTRSRRSTWPRLCRTARRGSSPNERLARRRFCCRRWRARDRSTAEPPLRALPPHVRRERLPRPSRRSGLRWVGRGDAAVPAAVARDPRSAARSVRPMLEPARAR